MSASSPSFVPSSTLRVLHIVAGLDIGQTFGGAERSGVQLAVMQTKNPALDVTVCAFWTCGGAAEAFWLDKMRAAGITTFFANATTPNRDFGAFRRAVATIYQSTHGTAYDVIHAHHEGGALAAMRLQRAKMARTALRTVYVPTHREWGNGLGTTIMRLATTQSAFPLVLDAEVAVAPQFVATLNRRPLATLLRRKARLIYNTSAEVAPAHEGAPLPIQLGDKVIGTLARLTEQKGLKYLIDAAPLVLAREPRALFIIAGDGEDRSALEAQAKVLGVSERVLFLGRRDDGANLLRQMRLFVLPSLWEGVPLALVEAAMAGVPAVVTNIDGNRELIKHSETGWAVPPRNAVALADAILDALARPEVAAERAKNAQQLAERTFSLPVLTAQYIELYRELLAD